MKEKTIRTLENIIAGSFAVVLLSLLGYKGIQELELMHYRNKAENTICKLAEKYEVSNPEVIVNKSRGRYGNYYENGIISLSSDTILNNTPIDEWYFAEVHEFGHYLFSGKIDQDKFRVLYLKSLYSLSMAQTFKEGLLEEIPDIFGHPEDAPTELFASAFVISECGLIDKYKEKYFPEFTAEQKQLAEQIFEFVQRGKK